ncbi:MFS transporter [Candidatus Roizmanbacteria bacterium]|nr:MFS transporter [Candidatus Roizmanbacteria bacterium]
MNQRLSPFIALQYSDFRLLWIGLFISSIGSQMQLVAVNWHIYLLTKSAFSLGIIGFARFLPMIILSPFSGIIADMIDRKKLMLLAQIFMTIFSLILTITTFLHIVSPTMIYFLIAALSAASSFDMPARQSLVPSLVPKKHFINAVSINTTMWQASMVLGPSLGGFIIASLGIGNVYLINAFSFIAVIIAILAMAPLKKQIIEKPVFNVASLKEGFVFVKNTPMIYSTMLLDFIATFFSSATVLLPIFAHDILRVGPKGLGLLYGAPSIGAIIAGLIISSHGARLKQQGILLLSGVFIYGFSTILFGISRSFILSFIFLMLSGVGDMVSTVIRNTIRQLMTPDYIRGRMVAVNMIFFMGGPQLGELEAGVVAGLFGTPLSVVVGGLGTIIATIIIAIRTPQLRKYQEHELVT